MNDMKRSVTIAICGAVLAATAAHAAQYTGVVKAVRVDVDGRAMVQFTSALSGVATCCTSQSTCMTDSLAFDTKTPGGKALLSLVTSAKLSGKSLAVTSAGVCTSYPGYAEDVQSAVLQP